MSTEQSTKAAVVRLMFDRERKLVAKHKYIREAVRTSGKTIQQLVNDPFGGHPYLLAALLELDQKANERALSLDRASELLDLFYEKGGTLVELTQGLLKVVESYLRIENTPGPSEDPNGSSPGGTEQGAG